jgi:hypothetical protein
MIEDGTSAMTVLAYAIQDGVQPVAVVGLDRDGELYVASSQRLAETVASLRQALAWLEGRPELVEAPENEGA